MRQMIGIGRWVNLLRCRIRLEQVAQTYSQRPAVNQREKAVNAGTSFSKPLAAHGLISPPGRTRSTHVAELQESAVPLQDLPTDVSPIG